MGGGGLEKGPFRGGSWIKLKGGRVFLFFLFFKLALWQDCKMPGQMGGNCSRAPSSPARGEGKSKGEKSSLEGWLWQQLPEPSCTLSVLG